jgi:hypothetical protein
MLNNTSATSRKTNLCLFDPFQEPANWAECYGAEIFDSCCRGYEGIPAHEWEPANENVKLARVTVTFFPKSMGEVAARQHDVAA